MPYPQHPGRTSIPFWFRLRCDDCTAERLVPFTCGGRGFCPTCCARRMTERASHLVDYVIPEVPVRQYVLTLPFRLRFLAAFDHDLRRAVLRVFTNSVFAHYRLRARRIGLDDSRCGSVTVTQRFDSRLGLNVHFHSIVLDGVYVRTDPDSRPVFHPLAPPTDGDIEHLVARIARKVRALLDDRGLTDDDAFQACVDDLIEDDPSLIRLAAASAQGTLALGTAMGHPVPRLYTQPPESEPLQHHDPRDGDTPPPRRHPPRCAAVDGFPWGGGFQFAGIVRPSRRARPKAERSQPPRQHRRARPQPGQTRKPLHLHLSGPHLP